MANRVSQLAKIMPSAWDSNSTVHYSKMTDSINTLLGYSGPVPFQNSLDLNNNPIQNVAAPKDPTDALNLGTADSKYSPAVLSPQLDIGGKYALKGLTNLYLQSQKGFTGTITTAKLTTLGTNGSITFKNGIVVSQVPAT